MPESDYVELLLKELRTRSKSFSKTDLSSIYFGGGTPSLLPAESIVAIINEIHKLGFNIIDSTEITVEINPGTIKKPSLETYIAGGVNRFSVGAQTFDEALLKACDRIHSVDETHNTLRLLNHFGLNYSFDLLYALPNQSREQLSKDLQIVKSYQPPHLSAYCLTVPEGHPMSFNRPSEDVQVEMLHEIERELSSINIKKYEISNFSKPGFESTHNSLYWSGEAFWGIGLSAHSYLPGNMTGKRFWNPKSFPSYINQVSDQVDGPFYDSLPSSQIENLAENEFLTDFCHMAFRTIAGLQKTHLATQLSDHAQMALAPRLSKLVESGLLDQFDEGWQLSKAGELLSNRVFAELTFLEDELS